MKVIIAGSRGFSDYALACAKLDKIFSLHTPSAIISGTANGADLIGERYAREHGIPVERFPADWNRFGKSAGYRRNELMAQHGDALVAFWDGQSRGTRHMINLAKEYNLAIRVIKY